MALKLVPVTGVDATNDITGATAGHWSAIDLTANANINPGEIISVIFLLDREAWVVPGVGNAVPKATTGVGTKFKPNLNLKIDAGACDHLWYMDTAKAVEPAIDVSVIM